MTPNLTIRSFSNDQYYLDKVFYTNSYKIKGHKDGNGPIIVDIGAHAGYFTFAALSLGAKKVYAFEPFPDNYRLLLKNTESAPLGRVIPYQLGVWAGNAVLPIGQPKLLEGTYYDYANLTIGDDDEIYHKAYFLDLKFALNKIVRDHIIDILKIGFTEGAEDVIKSDNQLSNKVRNIVFESESDPEYISNFIRLMYDRGFKESAVSKIEDEEKFIIILSTDKINNYFNIEMKAERF